MTSSHPPAEVEEITPEDRRRATLLAVLYVRGNHEGVNEALAAIADSGRLTEAFVAVLDALTEHLAPMMDAADLEARLLSSLDRVLPPEAGRPW